VFLFPICDRRNQFLTKILPFIVALFRKRDRHSKSSAFPRPLEQELTITTRNEVMVPLLMKDDCGKYTPAATATSNIAINPRSTDNLSSQVQR